MDPQDEVLLQRIGQTIAGRWTLHALIGAGGMAAVYAARDAAGQAAAIKILYPEMGRRKDIRERFLREAAVMSRIVHPSMVTIFEQGQSGELAYLAMELLSGETVADRVRRLGRLEPNEVLAILDQTLDVLQVAHALGIIHRDLKPENLFLTREGRLKVLDFGLARLLDAGAESFRTRTGAALGTLPYMAPEQALGRRDDIDARTDIFAVGATAYRLLSGRRIHEAPSEAELLMCMASEPAKSLTSVAPDVPPQLGAVVDRALAFAKANRYPDAHTMQLDVRAIQNGQAPMFALAARERNESATRVDRQAASPAGTPSPPNATERHVPAARATAAVEPVRPMATAPEVLADNGANSAPRAPLAGTAIEPATAPRPLPQTVAMPASSRVATLADSAHAPTGVGASIPQAPISDAVLARRRRRTLIVGIALFLGSLVAITAATLVLFRSTDRAPPNMAPSASAAAPNLEAPDAAEAEGAPSPTRGSIPMRHPRRVMMPLDEPETHRHASEPRAPTTPAAPPGAEPSRAAQPLAAPATTSDEPKANLLPTRVDAPTPAPQQLPPNAAPSSPVAPTPNSLPTASSGRSNAPAHSQKAKSTPKHKH